MNASEAKKIADEYKFKKETEAYHAFKADPLFPELVKRIEGCCLDGQHYLNVYQEADPSLYKFIDDNVVILRRMDYQTEWYDLDRQFIMLYWGHVE